MLIEVLLSSGSKAERVLAWFAVDLMHNATDNETYHEHDKT